MEALGTKGCAGLAGFGFSDGTTRCWIEMRFREKRTQDIGLDGTKRLAGAISSLFLQLGPTGGHVAIAPQTHAKLG
jgi:hypothetical protein